MTRYPMKIHPVLRGIFWLFGWSASRSYAELDDQALTLHFGGAHTQIPLVEIAAVKRRRWPIYFGYGAKYGPSGGVAYVGSSKGVVQIDFIHPQRMHVWGPVSRAQSRCAVVSLENADLFLQHMQRGLMRSE